MTIDELAQVLRRQRRVTWTANGPGYFRGLDMFWSYMAEALSERGQCQIREGCPNPADFIVSYSNGHMGSESIPLPRCAEHAGNRRKMVVWEDGGWDWLRRSYWDDVQPLPEGPV